MKVLKFTALVLCLFLASKITAQQTAEPVKIQGPVSSLEFESAEFNWGELIQGEKIQNVFRFVNTGSDPIVITNAKGSCGCTVPQWPKEPIMPGATAQILVQFDSKNKKGLQSKRVTITANTDPVNTYLTIKGKIVVPTEEEKAALVRNEKNFDVDASTVSVFPNPTATEVNVSLMEYEGQSALIEIYDMLGDRVEERTVESIDSAPISFDTSQYMKGTYVLVVKIGEKNRLAKQFSVLR